jgi:hypothetical protein
MDDDDDRRRSLRDYVDDPAGGGRWPFPKCDSFCHIEEYESSHIRTWPILWLKWKSSRLTNELQLLTDDRAHGTGSIRLDPL